MTITPIGGYFGVVYLNRFGELKMHGLDAKKLNDALRLHEAQAYHIRDQHRAAGRWAQVIQFGNRDADEVRELVDEYVGDDDFAEAVEEHMGAAQRDERAADAEMRQATSMAHLRCASDEATATTTMEMWAARKR